MQTLVADLRFALRLFRRNPGFSAVAILTLALGIGANTAIFSVVNAVLLEPLPYREPIRLAFVWERNTAIGKPRDLVAPANYQDWKAQNTAFEGLAAYSSSEFVLASVEDVEQVVALNTTATLFSVLGVPAIAGRPFTEDEERRRERVVVLGHAFWQRRFGGDRGIVGRSIRLTDVAYTVVGVMPPGFRFPEGNPVDVYSPLVFTAEELRGRRGHTLTVIGRLKEGVTIDSATANLAGIARNIAVLDSTSNPDVDVVGAHALLVEDVRLGIVVLLGTVGLVLLIACVNVANLLLARASSRGREIAIRSALGGSAWRLVRQLLTESLLLAFAGGALGCIVAVWALPMLKRFSPPDLPRIDQVRIDIDVLVFAGVVGVATGVLFGIVPALQMAASRASEMARIKETVSASLRHRRGRSGLVVAEVALSVILLIGAGLMIRTLLAARQLELGFQPENVLTLQISLPFSRYPVDPAQYRPVPPGAAPSTLSKPGTFYVQLMEKLNALPGVLSAGAVTSLPLNPAGIDFDLPVVIQGKPRPRPGEEPQADFRVATTDYYRTMGIPLLAGRTFTESDGPASAAVAIINDTMARQMFAGEDPVGQRLFLYGRPREIVGVVGSVRHQGYARDPRPEMILPFGQFQFGSMTIVLRSQIDPAALAAAVKREVRGMDASLPITRVRPLVDDLGASVSRLRFTTVLLAAFAGLALVLALVGVYSVMAYTVSQRAREIGVRMALGARRSDVLLMVVGQGMRLAALGVLAGLGCAVFASRGLSGLLFGVSATDPASFAAAALALVLASLVATYIPARRATRIDPIQALHQ